MARPRSSLKSKSKSAKLQRAQGGLAWRASRRRACRRKQPAKQSTGKSRWVYAFGGGKADGKAGMRNLLGGKGAGLAEMANLGLPVPPGFTITTEVCTHYYANGNSYPRDARSSR